jgi:Holliday junction resolvase RusA-like endonuclease
MSPMFSRDEMREVLRRQNVGTAAIERTLLREFGELTSNSVRGEHAGYVDPPKHLDFPFRLTIPWSELCSDNEKETAGLVHRSGKVTPRKVLTARYKASKEAIRKRAKAIVSGEPSTDPLSIVVRVYLPPSRRNDAINFAKVMGDALEGVVFANDNQLHDSRWLRAGVDIDAPRAEVEIARIKR